MASEHVTCGKGRALQLTCRDDRRHETVGAAAGRRRPVGVQHRLLAQHHGLRCGAVQAAAARQTVQVGAAVGAPVQGGGPVVQPQGLRVHVGAERGRACMGTVYLMTDQS